MKWAKFLGTAFIFVLLLFKPEQAVASAQQAMGIWCSSVAPALFPFLVLMPMLSSREACIAYEKLFGGWMRPLFRLPGSAAPAVIVGMIAGSPGGAIALRGIAANSNLSRSQAQCIALAVGGVSPAYLIAGVGQNLHGSARLGIELAAAQAIVQLFLLFVLPRYYNKGNEEGVAFRDEGLYERNSIIAAVESITCVCGYMVFYSVIAGVLVSTVGKEIGSIILPIMDLPSGLAALSNSRLQIRMMLQSAAIGFTGLCIIFQNMNVLEELNIKWSSYIGVRVISGMLLALVGTGLKSKGLPGIRVLLEDMKMSYSISLLMVGILIVPALYLYSKKLFLNKRKIGNNREKSRVFSNIWW